MWLINYYIYIYIYILLLQSTCGLVDYYGLSTCYIREMYLLITFYLGSKNISTYTHGKLSNFIYGRTKEKFQNVSTIYKVLDGEMTMLSWQDGVENMVCLEDTCFWCHFSVAGCGCHLFC